MRPRSLAATGLAVACIAVLVLSGSTAGAPAGADSAPAQGSAHAQAGYAPTTAATLTPTATPSGAVGLLGSLTSSVVNPLLDGLTKAPQQALTQVTAALSGAGLQADNPSTQQARPSSGYPDCSTQGWNSSDCYGPAVPVFASGSLVTLGTGTVQGYATGDQTGFIGAARSANPELVVLGIDLGNLGVIDASASCTTTTCTCTQTLSGGSLLGGALTMSVANGNLTAQVNGAAIPAAGTTVTAAGVSTKVKLSGNLLTLQVGLTVAQLFNGLGLSTALSALGPLATTTGSAITLTVTLGPGGTVVSGTSAESYGLDVGVDLNVDLVLTLLPALGVAAAGVEVTTKGSTPDLLDLKLAYAKTFAGPLLPGWVPSGLI